jgi:hypothetical protein
LKRDVKIAVRFNFESNDAACYQKNQLFSIPVRSELWSNAPLAPAD